jgi:hypothetical protein
MNVINEYNLGFCNIKHRDDGIVEFEIADGINVDAEMVKELTDLAEEKIHEPFAILSNRINSYSLSFEAMTQIAHYENIAALAIIVHSSKSQLMVETQNFFISKLKKKPIKIFGEADSAVEWLHNELQAVRSQS